MKLEYLHEAEMKLNKLTALLKKFQSFFLTL
jgi:hypothetical protein